MKLDENEFFRQATLRICSSLDIETAMFNCLQYLRLFMPASEMCLTLFELDARIIRNLAWVTQSGSKRHFPPTPMSREAVQLIESVEMEWQTVKIIDETEGELVARILRPYIDLSSRPAIAMILIVEGQRLGTLAILQEEKGRLSKAHAQLISLLREPFSIATSNALRYQEVVRLKDMVDAENRELSRELRHLSKNEIICAEYGLKGIMEMVRQVSPLNSPVMLLGETGVGKEVIANAIHHSSPRKSNPFIKVNCGAIPANLLDSELFGHEKGAFTGAIGQKRGRFERADRGTIFLDEIGDLPLQAQVRLLRVLQHKEIERVGGSKTIPVDVRIIAATHRNMQEMISNGSFREDLWFRVNIFPIMIPPLRHRKEDIPALVHHFLEKKSKELKLYPLPSISSEGMERLKNYSWPGNVRELENLLERELIRHRGQARAGRMIFEHFDPTERDTGIVTWSTPDVSRELLTLDEAMSVHIRQALRLTRGKIYGDDGAARLLGINPSTLRSRIRKLGLSFRRVEV